jgi:hypothetical protein
MNKQRKDMSEERVGVHCDSMKRMPSLANLSMRGVGVLPPQQEKSPSDVVAQDEYDVWPSRRSFLCCFHNHPFFPY